MRILIASRPRLSCSLLALLLVLGLTCIASTQEIRFPSGGFTIVGDLRLPDAEGPHPAIIMIHGDGGVDRTDGGKYQPLFNVFLRAGYAVLSWDKPGVGETEGTFGDGAWIITYRTDILLDAIEFVRTQPTIGGDRIGAWGISQGGIVIPMALSQAIDLAFVIIVSGPGTDGIGQYAHLIGQYVQCEGGTGGAAALAEENFDQMARATDYETYRVAQETLVTIPGTSRFVGREVATESDWIPWNPAVDSFFDPMTAIRTTTIPVLAFFGELDKQVNPTRGFNNYQAAITDSGHPLSRVELIAGVDHNLVQATTGCLSEQARRPSYQWLSYAEDYLEILEDWLMELR